MPKSSDDDHEIVSYVVCNFCGEKFPPVEKVVLQHIHTVHAKELAHVKLDQFKLRAKDPTDTDAQLALAEGIAEYTRKYLADDTDKVGAYSVEEALGTSDVHLMYQRVMDCGYPHCVHNGPTPVSVDKAIAKLKRLGERGYG